MKKTFLKLIKKGAEAITIKETSANVKGLSYLYILKAKHIYQCWSSATMVKILERLLARGYDYENL